MKFISYEEKYFTNLLNLWNEEALKRGFFKPFSEERFKNHFINHSDFMADATFLAIDNEEVVGVVSGFIRKSDRQDFSKPAYLTTILVKSSYRKKGIGSKLITMLEDYMKGVGRKYLRLVFLSTLNWPWYIPNTDQHDHPGAPAVVVNSEEYFFLLHRNFKVQGFCDAFHLPLSEYQMPDEVIQRMKENNARGFSIDIYDEKVHYGLEDFYQAIKDEPFERAIRSNLAKEKPNPFLVISNNGKITGWTGAMYTEESGRAHFDGIIADPNVRGGGLGKALFCHLCEYSKQHGSSFMTFFTGLENPARNIYLYAGFKIIQTFAIMRKELN